MVASVAIDPLSNLGDRKLAATELSFAFRRQIRKSVQAFPAWRRYVTISVGVRCGDDDGLTENERMIRNQVANYHGRARQGNAR